MTQTKQQTYQSDDTSIVGYKMSPWHILHILGTPDCRCYIGGRTFKHSNITGIYYVNCHYSGKVFIIFIWFDLLYSSDLIFDYHQLIRSGHIEVALRIIWQREETKLLFVDKNCWCSVLWFLFVYYRLKTTVSWRIRCKQREKNSVYYRLKSSVSWKIRCKLNKGK